MTKFSIRRYEEKAVGGFSLVELLIVIGIIALLTFMAFPALNSGIQAARLTKCASNLRQWGTGFQLYMAENDGFLPQASEIKGDGSTGWQEKIAPYVMGKQGVDDKNQSADKFQRGAMRRIFHCPGDRTPNIVYGGNQYLRPVVNTSNSTPAPKKLANLNKPAADFMLLAENYTGDMWDTHPWNGSTGIDYSRHTQRNTSNFLFADFHVEALNYRDTLNRPVLTIP